MTEIQRQRLQELRRALTAAIDAFPAPTDEEAAAQDFTVPGFALLAAAAQLDDLPDCS